MSCEPSCGFFYGLAPLNALAQILDALGVRRERRAAGYGQTRRQYVFSHKVSGERLRLILETRQPSSPASPLDSTTRKACWLP